MNHSKKIIKYTRYAREGFSRVCKCCGEMFRAEGRYGKMCLVCKKKAEEDRIKGVKIRNAESGKVRAQRAIRMKAFQELNND